MDEQDITFCFFDFFHHVEEVGAFFFENFVHLPVVVHDDLVLHVRFWRAELKLDEAYSGFFHSRWSASAFDDGLVEDQAVDHFTVLYRAANFLDYSDVL